ncbi:hypothetical protein FHS18_005729 [Paenibacillus phyllosphaerae]|uniref:Sporulation lipoprotein, YhcN/YlaJ family n=1 Tax=Paenibacillus phyllosphaerae TaxID=274593 RepID=A0A7W5B4N5_9BACL|nr:YhcN/YlaJ family sporulation lipoprotein [Paenibacillus phyllosphaerae]MBB3113616.1 hypothetical protein [Paenibacillus phyllosphaerae]
MQRKWLLLAAGAMLGTLIAGCSENHGELGNRNIRQYEVREDGNGNMVLKNRFASDQMNDRNRMNGRRLNSNNIIGSHRNYQLEMSPKLSEEISNMSGIGQAYVMLTDNNAYVALSGKDLGRGGLSAKSVSDSVRPLSRTDMAYLPPGSHLDSRSSMRDTMGRSNYEMMMESRHMDARGRFDSTKSYDSTKTGRLQAKSTTSTGRLQAKSLPGTNDTFSGNQNASRFNYNMNQLRNETNFTNPAPMRSGNEKMNMTTYGVGENRWQTKGYRTSKEYDMYGSGNQPVRPYSALGTTPQHTMMLTADLKERIAAEVKQLDPSVEHVYVSSDNDFVDRMSAYMEDVRLGHPIQAYIAEFNAMVERIFPPQAVNRR